MSFSRGKVLLASLLLSALAPLYGQSDEPQLRTSLSHSGPGSSNPNHDARAGDEEKIVAPIPPNAPHISRQTRLEIIRDFEMQLVYARTAFPMGTKGLQLRQGVITPSGQELEQVLNLWGPAVKAGDPAHISFVQIKDDHIRFEINGGPIKRKKWYERVQVSGANGPVTQTDVPQENPHGTYVDLYFDKYVPEASGAQFRQLLYPVLDFSAHNKEQAYLNTLPPKVKEAVQAHHVLVGMNQEMVLHTKGKPPRKVREREGETQYEEWIYGDAPADVDFVRFVGDEVVRVETMRVDGQRIVRTEKEVILPRPSRDTDSDSNQEAKKEPQDRPASAPSLRRPGEDSEDVPKPANGAAPPPPMPPPDLPQPPSGPGEIVAVGR